jgi:catechol 2,3-dioxygenase-like lactoylglutathione lyase family enzyme
MDYQLQVITLPVTDVDKAAAFYRQQAGFTLDVDYHPVPGHAASRSVTSGTSHPSTPGLAAGPRAPTRNAVTTPASLTSLTRTATPG